MDEENELLKEYFNALYNLQNGNNLSMGVFKIAHPKEYALINAMYHKRVKVKHDIETMLELSKNKVYFGTLTFDDVQDKKSERTKRRQAWRHLNQCFSMVLVVEENGNENGRYHIHFCGAFRDGKRFEDFFGWSGGREQIERVRSKGKVARYLCDYVVKSVPRLRRNKCLIECSKKCAKARSFDNYGFKESLGNECRNDALGILFYYDNEVL